MSATRKTVLKGFDYLHCDDFADYLEEMAAKGWHFKEWGTGLVFERGEPRKDHYAVEVFIDGTEYDTRPEVRTREFAEYCQAAGWALVDAKRKFCIFRQVAPHAEEILTDEERLQNIAKEERKEVIRQLCMTLWFSLLQLLQLSGSSFVNYIFSNDLLFIVLLWFALAVGALVRALLYVLWVCRTKKQIAVGEKVHFGRSKGILSFFQGKYSWLTFAVVVFYIMFSVFTKQFIPLLYVVGLLLPIVVMGYLISRFRPDAVTNQIIQTVVPCLLFILLLSISLVFTFSDESGLEDLQQVPLLYEDIDGEAGALTEATLDGSSSIFGSGLRCWLYYEQEHIYYQVYRSEHRWVLDRIWKLEMKRKYNQLGTDVTANWGAEAAIRNVPGSYLVRYQDAILILNFAENTLLTSGQIQTIREALYESR